MLAESGIVGSEGGQHSRVIERRVQRLLEIADPGDDLRIQKGVQVLEGERFLLQGIESPQDLDVLFGKEGDIGVGQNFDQGNLKGRKWK